MESGSANDAWRALNKERVPIEGLGSGPGLRIPDVEVDGAEVRSTSVANDTRGGCELDEH